LPLNDAQRREIEERFGDRRIFVQVAAYRDGDLPNTVRSALAHAASPARIRFGICHQYDDRTIAALEEWRDDPRITVDRISADASRGVGWARARTQALWDHEPYTLQVDAHTRFADGWDERFVAMLDSVDRDRPILSGPPLRFHIGADGIEHREAQRAGRARHHWPRPALEPRHLFTVGRFCRDVPYDERITAGDEAIDLAVRAYTHGYDLRIPDECLVWHWKEHPFPRHPGDRRVRSARGGSVPLGLGGARTVAAYEHFAGLRRTGSVVGTEDPRCR
jgi:hypothetical protein